MLSILVFASRYGLAPLWRRRPIWLRNFAAQEPMEAEVVLADYVTPPKPKSWGLSTTVLAANSFIGLITSVLASLKPTIGPIFLVPVVPHVGGNLVMTVSTLSIFG